jgi:hypothetical protein
VLEEVRGAGEVSGLGACCSPLVATEAKVLCLKFWAAFCRAPMSTVVRSVDYVLRRHGLADVRVGVDVSLKGEVGPRCEPTDPSCGPLPDWQGDAALAQQTGCVAGRVRVGRPDSEPQGGACAHDGECLIGARGCAERCVRWDEPASFEACAGVDFPNQHRRPPIYCGCVEGHCDWFRPVAP